MPINVSNQVYSVRVGKVVSEEWSKKRLKPESEFDAADFHASCYDNSGILVSSVREHGYYSRPDQEILVPVWLITSYVTHTASSDWLFTCFGQFLILYSDSAMPRIVMGTSAMLKKKAGEPYKPSEKELYFASTASESSTGEYSPVVLEDNHGNNQRKERSFLGVLRRAKRFEACISSFDRALLQEELEDPSLDVMTYVKEIDDEMIKIAARHWRERTNNPPPVVIKRKLTIAAKSVYGQVCFKKVNIS
eukprot:sb/3468798/